MSSRSIVKIWLLSRLWFGFFVYLGHLRHPFLESIENGYAGVSNWWLNPWTTYDSRYFLELARNGYTVDTSVFFPFYPLLLRLFGPSENSMALAGIIISNLSFLGAMFLFYRLSRFSLDERLAMQSVWVLAFLPSAVHSMAVYTESVFLLLTLAAFYAARTKRWLWVAPFALLAALTRNAGPILGVALLVEWFVQRKANPKTPWWAALTALAPFLGFLGVQWYLRQQFGSALASVSGQKSFGRTLSFPWVPIWRDTLHLLGRPEISTLFNVLASILVFVFAWKYRRRLPLADNVLMCGVMLMTLCFGHVDPPYTISSFRYVFSTWPFSQSVALEIESKQWNVLRTLLIAVGLMISAAFAYMFGLKWFVS